MATSQNGWPAPPARTRKTIIPGTGRHFVLADGPVALILAHLALWYHETIEPIGVGIWDDWGFAFRPIRGDESNLSNHASGTALDLNATLHGLGGRRTGVFAAAWAWAKIRARLAFYRGVVRWGGFYTGRADEMHWEINRGRAAVHRLAFRLLETPRGKRVCAANPGLYVAVVKATV